MKIAVVGCAHGELDRIYEALEHLQTSNNVRVDLLIVCGDFQAVRNYDDLHCMAVPPKYRKLNSFHKYYSGAKVAPVLTIFVGGNHEASNYLSELSYGGWICPNIFYMGYANVINIGGLRIAGLSGIYKGQDYLRGHFECPPYNEATKRSMYHVRNIDVFRLKQIAGSVDIFISHDWPRGIYNFGDKDNLLRWKPFFKDEVENNKLGSRPSEELLDKLKPAYWFAAHLHCKFAAVVPHGTGSEKTITKFLALDKCLPRRKFLQIVDVGRECSAPTSVHYDPEWLSILRSTNCLLNTTNHQSYMPGPGCSGRWNFSATQEEMKNVKDLFDDDFAVPLNFQRTALPHTASSPMTSNLLPKSFVSPQTTAFCAKLNITDPFAVLIGVAPNRSPNKAEFSFVENLDVTTASEQSINPDGDSFSEHKVNGKEQKGFSEDRCNNDSISIPKDSSFFIDTRGLSPKRENQVALLEKKKYQHHGSVTQIYNEASDFCNFKRKRNSSTSEDDTSISENRTNPPKRVKGNHAVYYTF